MDLGSLQTAAPMALLEPEATAEGACARSHTCVPATEHGLELVGAIVALPPPPTVATADCHHRSCAAAPAAGTATAAPCPIQRCAWGLPSSHSRRSDFSQVSTFGIPIQQVSGRERGVAWSRSLSFACIVADHRLLLFWVGARGPGRDGLSMYYPPHAHLTPIHPSLQAGMTPKANGNTIVPRHPPYLDCDFAASYS